jgi:hypothetical protein
MYAGLYFFLSVVKVTVSRVGPRTFVEIGISGCSACGHRKIVAAALVKNLQLRHAKEEAEAWRQKDEGSLLPVGPSAS